MGERYNRGTLGCGSRRLPDGRALLLLAITTLPMMPKAIGGMRWKRGKHGNVLCSSTRMLAHLGYMDDGG